MPCGALQRQDNSFKEYSDANQWGLTFGATGISEIALNGIERTVTAVKTACEGSSKHRVFCLREFTITSGAGLLGTQHYLAVREYYSVATVAPHTVNNIPQQNVLVLLLWCPLSGMILFWSGLATRVLCYMVSEVLHASSPQAMHVHDELWQWSLCFGPQRCNDSTPVQPANRAEHMCCCTLQGGLWRWNRANPCRHCVPT